MFLGLPLRSKSVLRNLGEYSSLPFVWRRCPQKRGASSTTIKEVIK
jgi:hypothetical protein